MNKNIYLLVLLALAGTSARAQAKFGDNKASINPGSVLELESTNKGMLLPRVALSDRLVWGLNGTTPAKGMVVYNTNATGANGLDTGMLVWQGQWNPIGGATAGNYWRLNGNAGTTPPTALGMAAGTASYWGTSDAQNLAIGTNGTIRAILDQNGGLYGGFFSFNPAISPSQPLVWGQMLTDSSDFTLLTGAFNTIESFALGSAILGTSNRVKRNGSSSLVTGSSNTTAACFSIMAGSNNIAEIQACNAAIFGSLNRAAIGSSVLISGLHNIDSAQYSFIAGSNNIVSPAMADATVVGRYNEPVDSTLLAVGNGILITSPPYSQVRSNAITIVSTIPAPTATANNATLNVNGSVAMAISTVSTDTILTNADYKIVVRSSGAAHITLTLPDPATCTGRMYLVHNMNADGGGVKFNYPLEMGRGNTIATGATALTGHGDGSAYSSGNALLLQSDGTGWTAITF